MNDDKLAYPGLDSWIDLVRRLDADFDGIDIADTFWLARHLVAVEPERPAVPPSPPPPEPPLPPQPPQQPGPKTPQSALPSNIEGERRLEERSIDLFPKSGPVGAGKSVVLPDVAAIDNKLALGRALRPLRRRVESTRRFALDEAATAARIATLRLAWPQAPLLPTFRPARSRWLDAVLLIDRSQSMALRRRAAEEWEVLLNRLGAFRNLRVWHLLPGRDGGEPELASPSGDATPWTRRSVDELTEARGCRLVMILSDCLGPFWHSPSSGQWLARQAMQGPLAILQVLPPHLWRRTALGRLDAVTLRARTPGAASHRLLAIARDDEDDDEATTSVLPPIPVLPLEVSPVEAWARMVVGHPLGTTAGYRFALTPVLRSADGAAKDVAGADRVERFLRGSTAPARKLAAYLAAVPLTAPIVRIVRQALVPEAGEEHVTEVIFSDLVVQRVDDLWKATPDDELYDFRSGVREKLLEALGVTKIESVARRIGEFLQATRGSEFNFSAILDEQGDPSTGATTGARPFASVSSALFAATRRKPVVSARSVTSTPHVAVAPEVATEAGQRRVEPENGFWILVDGTDKFELAPWELECARELGAALARGGFSLVTLGLPGVAHVVARAFWEVLKGEGYSSGIYRLLHVVARGEKADFEMGRAIYGPGERPVAATLARADHVVRVGKSRYTDDVIGVAAASGLQISEIAGAGRGSSAAVVDRLRAQFAAGDDRSPALVDIAAVALDARDLDEYNRRLRRLERLKRSQVGEANAPSIERLLRDRRPSYRLLGHVAVRDQIRPEVLLASCQAEERTVTLFWETRTLWFALEALGRQPPTSSESHAFAAMCASFERDLDAAPGADSGGDCKRLLRKVAGRFSSWDRAKTLRDLAVQYEAARREMPSGPQRTARMHEIMGEVGKHAPAGPMEAEVWFDSAYDGHRIVALELTLQSTDLSGWRIVIDGIAHPRSPFEQYTALSVAHAKVTQLDGDQRAELRATIEAQRTGPKASIGPGDPSRDMLSGSILGRIRELEIDRRALTFDHSVALVIGVDQPFESPRLRHARRVADEIASVLRQSIASQNVHLMAGDVLTKQQIASSFLKLTTGRSAGTLIVFFSGATIRRDGQVVMLTSDTAEGVSASEIFEQLPSDWHAVILSDSYLGTSLPGTGEGRGVRALLSPAESTHHAPEYARTLVKGLAGAAAGDGGLITLRGLFEYLVRESAAQKFSVPNFVASGPQGAVSDLVLARAPKVRFATEQPSVSLPAQVDWLVAMRRRVTGAEDLQVELRSLTDDQSLTVDGDRPYRYRIRSTEQAFDAVTAARRSGSLQDLAGAKILWLAREDRQPDELDPQLGKWGGLPERDGRLLQAEITRVEDKYRVHLTVTTTPDAKRTLEGEVTFHLHPTFANESRTVQVRRGVAALDLIVWGWFTVGAECDNGRTRLELDLGDLPRPPKDSAEPSPETIALCYLSYGYRLSKEASRLVERTRETLARDGIALDEIPRQPGDKDSLAMSSKAIESADVFVVLVTREGAASKFTPEEVRIAHEAFEKKGRPLILPVIVGLNEDLRGELRSYLDDFQRIEWRSPRDDDRVIDAIRHVARLGIASRATPPLKPADERPRQRDLLIPGTAGNKLLLDGQDAGWPSALTVQGWLAGETGYSVGLDALPERGDALVDVMSMESASILPKKTTLRPGSVIEPGDVLELVYNQFLGFDRFVYDFRSDIRDSGRRLLEHLIDRQPTNTRWRIVCHGQGGLSLVVASKLYARQHGDDDRAFASLVSHVAFIGVPFYGTVSAAAALIQGEKRSGKFAPHFRAIARTWPSLYQMLPVWPGCVRLQTGKGLMPATFDAMDPLAWPGAHIDPAMLARARATRAEFLDSPLSRMNGVKKTLVMSRAWPTANHLIVDGQTVAVPEPSEPGDTVVPADTTFGTAAPVEQDLMHLFGTSGDTMKHFALLVDPFVVALVDDFFKQEPAPDKPPVRTASSS